MYGGIAEDLQEKRQLDVVKQAATVRARARPWRAIIFTVLAIAAACADPVTDWSRSRVRLATDTTAMVAKTKKATAADAAPIELPRCPGSNRVFR